MNDETHVDEKLTALEEDRRRKDKPCSYLHVSATNFVHFLDEYNSSDYGAITLSMAHFYKAWDALYQSMLLLAGNTVRKSHEDYRLGKITGITDGLINILRDLKPEEIPKLPTDHQPSEWKIQQFKSFINQGSNIKNIPFYNSLDMLRELRNASEHDFLEADKGSYIALAKTLNPYIIPLMYEYILIYRDFHKEVKQTCDKRSKYCAFIALTTQSTPQQLEALIRVPQFMKIPKEKSDAQPDIMRALFFDIEKQYRKQNRELLYWSDYSGGQEHHLSTIEEDFVYYSQRQIAEELDVSHQLVLRLLEKHKLKSNKAYVLSLGNKQGGKSVYYSKALVTKLRELIFNP